MLNYRGGRGYDPPWIEWIEGNHWIQHMDQMGDIEPTAF